MFWLIVDCHLSVEVPLLGNHKFELSITGWIIYVHLSELVKNVWLVIFIRITIRNMHRIQNLLFWEQLFLRIKELVSVVLWLFSHKDIKLSVLYSPLVQLLIYLSINFLELETKFRGTVSFNKAIAVIVILSLELQSNIRSAFLCSLGKSNKIIVSNFVLIPPE